ncbi:MAG TPA: endopeptidase La [Bdellovibrionales bacterium]|nr:MAG: endopeptidase La [Bdellovibrionales bacterium GWB1_52_6]OFZ02592.1 MAG: endopeptidase La [Bdellovibrionales bacterium GWA1_52_35]HAR41284.1 endopeptidase La [Bdellovibrionales bacterium]HCM41445.1 endopeptidase La [Bdellovibrionales bacterium]
MSKKSKIVVPLLPLRDVIIFPHMVVPLFVGREKSINALEECVNKKLDLFLVAQRQATTVTPGEKDIFEVGTLGTILQILRLPDNTVKVLIEGKRRARILGYKETDRLIEAEIEEIPDAAEEGVEIEAMVRSLKGTFENYVKLNKRIPPEMLMSVNTVEEPSRLADLIVAHLNLKLEDKQEILELKEPSKRLEKLLELMQGEIEILQVERRIRTRVKKQMERSQKEYYLNEQMQAIQKELGEKDEFKVEIQLLEKQIRTKAMSKEAKEKAVRELKKLKMMSPMSAEATVVRNYIDWLVTLPWGEFSEDRHDIKLAEEVLNEDHYGLEEAKERILEYLAVRVLTEHSKGQILCFVGPPGVGKTSLGKSIARALNKKFVRCSLGGVRDEAEIRGHRRTYVGALPGKIIQSLKKAGSSNPVFLLDEVDKMSMDFRGDPSSALLEVLDPEQNIAFGDHYMEVDYDCSKVMFVLTANSLHTIPKPLLDRMEVITISGYTEPEKFNIVKKYVVSKQMEAHGLKAGDVEITDEAISSLIRNYTREAGVRNLERSVATVCRKTARKIVEARNQMEKSGKKKADAPQVLIRVTAADLEQMLGPPKYTVSKAEEANEIGLTNGLAYTDAGGDMLQIEVSVVPGKGGVKITGKLGEVMQESAATAMSYVRSRAQLLGLDKDFYQNIDIHLHVPEGAVPKDGPSAGITMATSITSALCRIPVKKDIAMTGEITLRGRVLPIGGLKEKLLAAKIGNIKTVLIPKGNVPDLKIIPKEITEGMTIIPVEHADEVLRAALELTDPDKFLHKADEALPIPPPDAVKETPRAIKH